MYGEPDKLAKAKETCHMTFQEAAKTALRGGAKELWLTHFSPSLNHPEDYLDQVQAIFPNTSLGSAGQWHSLTFTE